MAEENKFIGAGMIFPIKLNIHGRPNIHRDLELIRTSIIHILAWPMRHRYFNEDFGSRLEELIEEPDDAISASLFRRFVVDAITFWEKRVDLVEVQIEQIEPSKINARINYRVRKTKQTDSFIFPFYKEIRY